MMKNNNRKDTHLVFLIQKISGILHVGIVPYLGLKSKIIKLSIINVFQTKLLDYLTDNKNI